MHTEARRIDRFTYDLFRGNGWDDHVRVKQGRGNTYRISGGWISKPDLNEWHQVLAPNMPITYGQTVQGMLVSINAINRG